MTKSLFIRAFASALCVSIGLLLSACQTTELPNNDQPGADKMNLSPCACAQIDYTPKV